MFFVVLVSLSWVLRRLFSHTSPMCWIPAGQTERLLNMSRTYSPFSLLLMLLMVASQFPVRIPGQDLVALRGRILGGESLPLVPARLYIQSEDGKYFFADSTSPNGTAVRYNKDRGTSVEIHTTLSADPFAAEVPPGRYTITAERGKEYIPATKRVEIKNEPVNVSLNLRRWIDMAGRGWYSGDTHVHRTIAELPNLVLAEDLNVALPLTYWVTDLDDTPSENNKNPDTPPSAKLIRVDDTHVIWPMNTEYEIFTVNRKQHTLGAVFILNHSEAFDIKAQPAALVAKMAREQGGILDLDKHNWPWSMMLLPVMNVDLFELTNNHLWRTEFLFKTWYPEYAAEYMNIEKDDEGFSENGWMHFGFQNYYALLNCGFKIRPSAGTASGVHPVPLGFGRVYVYLGDQFDYGSWMRGLKAGRSFVTTGPMLFVRFNGELAGHKFDVENTESHSIKINGAVESVNKISRIEVIVNGEIVKAIDPSNSPRAEGGFHSFIDVEIETEGSSWVAVRCFERQPNGRERFAHSGPIHVNVQDREIRPRRAEVEYLIKRVEDELNRHQGVLPEDALLEYTSALQFYRGKLKNAR